MEGRGQQLGRCCKDEEEARSVAGAVRRVVRANSLVREFIFCGDTYDI